MKRDKEIFSFINEETERQKKGIELIASENYVSEEVLEAMGSVLTNKYAEGYPGKRYYGGCEVVDKVEDLARTRLKELFGAEYVNVQPHSGSQANAAVLMGLLQPGDKILGFDLSHGGHLTHGSPVSFSGRLYDAHFYPVKKETGLVDYDAMAEQAKKVKPKIMIIGASAYSRDWDYKTIREISDSVGAVIMADIAHPAGLIAKGILADPMEYCHIVTSTTHKTLRGPRGGIIMIGKDTENPWGIKTPKGTVRKLSSLISSSVFPGIQGGPLEHVIAAKAVAFGEALTDDFLHYAVRIVKNADLLAKEMIQMGYHIVSGGTDNHCMLIDLHSKHLTGKEAEDLLIRADITVNKNMVPFDDQPHNITSGIRLGTPAITTRGITEKEIPQIAHLIDDALMSKGDEKVLSKVRAEVNELMLKYPLFKA